MQKIRLALRGWNRRREEKNREFLATNTVWRGAPPASSSAATTTRAFQIDIDGLTVAYLDASGRPHYFDVETGEVVEFVGAAERYRRIPSQSENADRDAFIETVQDSRTRARLRSGDFRTELARDRALERGWYNFRNDRAIAAIEKWLREIGLK
jgi:hypothetical protein